MNLSRPTETFFYISVGLAVLAFLVFGSVLSLNIQPFWIMTAAFVVLLISVVTNN